MHSRRATISSGTESDGIAVGSSRPSVRWRVAGGAVLVIGIVSLIVSIMLSGFAARGDRQVVSRSVEPADASAVSVAPPADSNGEAMYVHVIGAVVTPGLVRLPLNARVVDAIAAASGLANDAQSSALNLARRVVDGEQLRVPRVGEPSVIESATHEAGSAARVNLNTAQVTELQTLPRVGSTMAKRIVDWRTAHGRFSSVDDLTSVSGVGEKTLDALRDLVVVG